jgi:septal ring factor EnvC (AmiA/AmiB activator)
MIDKTTEIRKLLAQGKTTREIAHELRVSLRDIHRVREQEGIDIGALEREKERREKDIGVLENRITQRRQELAQLENQISTLLEQKREVEAEIERKKIEVIHVKQPVEPIYFPENYEEVRKYLETLRADQLRSISQLLVNIMNDRAVRAFQDAKTRIEQQTRDMLKRT